MKKMNAIFGLGLMLIPGLALAHGSKVSMVRQSIDATLKKFEAEESASVSAFVGAKGWADGARIVVKVYLTGDKSVQYACTEHMSGGEEMIMCNKF